MSRETVPNKCRIITVRGRGACSGAVLINMFAPKGPFVYHVSRTCGGGFSKTLVCETFTQKETKNPALRTNLFIKKYPPPPPRKPLDMRNISASKRALTYL